MKKQFLFTMMCLFGLFSLNAQTRAEVVIGSGDNYVNSNCPTSTWYKYSFSQMIYTAAEIDQSGGVVTSLSFRLQTVSDYVRNFAIYMQNTDKESFNDYDDWMPVSAEDLVFEGEVDFSTHVDGWLTIEFANPFQYNGANILVCVDDNTGVYKDQTNFYHYPVGTEIRRAININNDNFNFTSDNVASYGGAAFPSDWSTYEYLNPQIKFDMTSGALLPIAVKPEALNLGDRANGAWAPAQSIKVSSRGETLNIASISLAGDYFNVTDVETPFELVKNEPLNLEITTGTGEGEMTDVLTIAYNDTVQTVELRAFAYEPKTNDVYELATTIESFPFEVTPNFDEIYNNYTLPGKTEDGKDVAYKFALENDAIVKASVTGTNGKVAIYNSDFNGVGGPVADNNYKPEEYYGADGSLEFFTPAGEYYVIASATESFTLNVETEATPLPVKANAYYPWDGQTDVESPLVFNWWLGSPSTTYVSEFQVLLGTTNPPTDVMIDWTDELVNGYELTEIASATKYYWQINVRNSSGVTEGDILSFTTELGVPQNLKASADKIYEDETVTLTWDAVEDDILGYNVYVNDTKVNETVVTTPTYTLDNLTYRDYGNYIYVTTVYEAGESTSSNYVYVTVASKAQISGTVYEQDGVTPVTGATITFVGEDAIGNEQTYTFTADANSSYQGEVYVGQYTVTAEVEGYQVTEKMVDILYGQENVVDIMMYEIYYPVRWVNAEEDETAVNVTWGRGFLTTDYEDFEVAGLSTRDWTVSDPYPWVLTENAYEGSYAIKSTGETIDKAVSSIEVPVNLEEDGYVGFYHKIQSEANCDLGSFYVDGELKSVVSGNQDWKYAEFYVPAGSHVYKWEYAKDSLTNTGLDAYFVDNISFYKELVPFEGGWVYYDDGEFITTIGTSAPSPVYWAMNIPETGPYVGTNLTKVAVYDAPENGANFTVNIHLGGDNTAPGELVHTQTFELEGKGELVEIALTNPVAIDGTKPLWIVMYCDELAYPAAGCASVNNLSSDWISLDGQAWNHAYEYGLDVSWIIRAYMEAADGKLRVVTSKDANPTFEGGVSTGSLMANANVTPVSFGVPASQPAVRADRAFASKYNVYRKNIHTNDLELMLEETADSVYTDNNWAELEVGAYQWGVAALYQGNRALKAVIDENFENGVLPEGWTIYNEDTYEYYPYDPSDDQDWKVGSSYTYNNYGTAMTVSPKEGQYFAYSNGLYYENIPRFYLVTPEINVAPGALMSFSYINPDKEYAVSQLHFAVSTSAIGPWTILWTTDYNAAVSWVDVQVDLSEYAGQKAYFSFIHEFAWGSGGGCVGIDNVKMFAESPESAIVWSNTLDKDMFTTVTVTASTDTQEPVTGTQVLFTNLVEEKYSYKGFLNAEGTLTIEDFRKGSYAFSVVKEGYSSEYDNTEVEIWDETTYNVDLFESLDPVTNLYVSPTGWVMWDGRAVGSGDEFSYDFEDGTLNGWVTIDADGDNYNWSNTLEYMEPGTAHNNSMACVSSESYVNYVGAVTPDNYLVTAEKCNIGSSSQLRFWVCAQDNLWAQEHYGVAVSVLGNTSADDFVTIWEETFSGAKSGEKTATRGTTEQTLWVEKVIDLSEYAGQSVYIALRHFNCTDMFRLNVDDVELVNAKKSNRALTAYQVYLDGDLLVEDWQNTYYQHENLVVGQEYTTTIVPVYTMSEGEDLSYTWTYLGCDKYEGVTDFYAEYVNNETVVTWTLPETEEQEGKVRTTRGGDWLTYDNGENSTAIGLTYDGEIFELFKWGVMFPAADMAQYAGQYLTKLSIFDCEAYDGELFIYEGGVSAPGTLLYSQDFTCTGVNAYVEIPLTTSVELSGNQNVWVVLSHLNGKQPAAGCVDQGDPNGRWLYFEGYGWLDNAMVAMPAATWQISAYVTDDENEIVEVPTAEILGVQLYRNGELVSKKLVQGETYTDKEAVEDDEFTIRVVYGGEKDLTYYAMSCPQETEVVYNMPCRAPKDLHAQSVTNPDGTFGALLSYPYIPPTSEWLYYDDGQPTDNIGGPSSYYWGIMFPVESLESFVGTNITKVSFYDCAAQNGTINIYYGGTSAPEILVHSQPFTATGTQSFVEHELSYPLPIDGDMNIWVVLGTTNGENYPSAQAASVGNPNARWISMDGTTWEDAASYDLDGTWMIRAFATNEAKGSSMPIETFEFVNTATGGTPMKDPNPSKAPTLKNYNIYRGTSLDDIELIAETTEKTYFDEIEKGTYYYQVTAVYEENGEECESTPAKSYTDPSQDYVVIEITSINENGLNGMMIYPNPTKGDLNIKVEAMTRITIANALGQIVYDKEVDSDNEIINMARYEAGVYMVRIVAETGVTVKRINVVK